MQEKDYLMILEQSLEKKVALLECIRTKNEQQRVLLLDENLTPDDFQKNVQEKAECIEKLNFLDEGFEETYGRVRSLLEAHPEEYREQIARLQELVRRITAAGSSIQAEEKRNYALAQKKFSAVKKQIRHIKASQHAVNQYYRTMTKRNYVDSQFLDNKK